MRARHLAAVVLLALAALPAAHAQDQPIRIIFPFAAGGSGDGLSRLVADKMQAALHRTVIVEARTGAAGRIGVMAVRNAPPDGVTLMVTPIATVAIYPLTYKALDYDPVKDFAPISQLATFDLAVAVAPNVPAASLAELIAWVKADANRAAFASPGAGSLPHFLGIMFGRATGLDMRQIAYRGSAAALTDLIAGHVPMLFTTVSDLLETHKAGRIRILATSGAARSAFTPEIPTFREAGFDLQGSGWYAAFAPAKTPAAIVNRYSTIMADAVRLPDVKERLLAYGLQPTGTTAAELAAIQKADIERLAPIVKASGFSAD